MAERHRYYEEDGEAYMRAMLYLWHNPYAYASSVDESITKTKSPGRHSGGAKYADDNAC